MSDGFIFSHELFVPYLVFGILHMINLLRLDQLPDKGQRIVNRAIQLSSLVVKELIQ